MTLTSLHWIPSEHRRPMVQRLAIVWAVALIIAFVNWSSRTDSRLDISLVYSFAISTWIWLLTDVARFAVRTAFKAQAPDYWPTPLRASLMLGLGIPLGYVLGTLVGDAYAGWSTWDLLHVDRTRFWGLLISAIAISAGFVAFFYQRGKAEALLRMFNESRLQLLQSQLQPHMLFNTLAHLRALIQTQPATALVMLDHLDDYLRSAMQASHHTSHTLSEEFARLNDYLSLMAIRLGPRLAYQLSLPPELAQQQIPVFILQPLVENAIRHGIEPQIAPGNVTISATRQGHELVLQVKDTGQGVQGDLADAIGPTSFGLQHVRERLMAWCGPQAKLEGWAVLPHGLCVQLTCPLGHQP